MVLIILFILILIFPSQAQAIAKFNTAYQIKYDVQENGNTHVSILVSQKNNLSVVFATDYGINLSQTRIANVKVIDEGTPIKPEVNIGSNQTTITFPFTHKAVGKDKVHNFSIDYDSLDIASKFGNTWQINIPRFDNDENVSDSTAILTIPARFGQPAYIDPKPDLVNGNTYYFSSKVLGNRPISAIFGKNQYYKAQIKYHLDNPSSDKVHTDIAIPPQTAYQEIYIESLDPKPIEIKTDIDGNLLATYEIKPKENLDINLKIFFRLNFFPNPNLIQLPGDNLKKTNVWDKDHINFTSPETKNLTSPKSIYDFVSHKLKYDFQKIGRPNQTRTTASNILLNPESAVCTDYTDLFVTLARRANIHARELEGVAISDNPNLKPTISSPTSDILHAWPEYFDEATQKWKQIDPTWGSTTNGIDYFNKLDFNHLVFVIHGQDPEYPVPAGGYKNLGQKTKDVLVEPIEEISFPKSNPTAKYLHRQNNQIYFAINNPSGVYYQNKVVIKDTEVNYEQIEDVTIPPYSSVQIKTYLKNRLWFGLPSAKAIIELDGQTQTIDYVIGPNLPSTRVLALGSFFLGLVALVTRSLLLRRQK